MTQKYREHVRLDSRNGAYDNKIGPGDYTIMVFFRNCGTYGCPTRCDDQISRYELTTLYVTRQQLEFFNLIRGSYCGAYIPGFHDRRRHAPHDPILHAGKQQPREDR